MGVSEAQGCHARREVRLITQTVPRLLRRRPVIAQSIGLHHEIEIGLPDAGARLHILGIHTREMPTDPDLDLDQIAGLTGSYSGADLEALCREAALVCMRRTINLRDFEKRIASHQLSALSVTTYDFRTAVKRIGPSIRR